MVMEETRLGKLIWGDGGGRRADCRSASSAVTTLLDSVVAIQLGDCECTGDGECQEEQSAEQEETSSAAVTLEEASEGTYAA